MSAYSWALCLEELPLLGFAAALLVAFADGLWSFPSVRGGGVSSRLLLEDALRWHYEECPSAGLWC